MERKKIVIDLDGLNIPEISYIDASNVYKYDKKNEKQLIDFYSDVHKNMMKSYLAVVFSDYVSSRVPDYISEDDAKELISKATEIIWGK